MKLNNVKQNKQKNNSFKSIFLFVKKYSTVFIIIFFFLFLYICDNFGSSAGSMIMNNLKSIATSFTPTTDLFDDGSEVSFVSYFFGMNSPKSSESTDFYMPTTMQNTSTNFDYLSYNYSGPICSVASGLVHSIGYTNNNEKYVEIEHGNNYLSRYVGLDYVGVLAGENVIANKPLGLLSTDKTCKIYIYQNDNLIKTNEVKWKE